LKDKILAISCHTDDVEVGCGALLHQLASEGYDICSVVFITSYPNFPDGQLLAEWHESMTVLGILHRFTFNYPLRKLYQHRQEILEELLLLKEKMDPDYILTPSITNIHQDHKIVGLEALRAFRDRILWNYELPWNEISFEPQIYVPISVEDLEVKIKALSQYKSQHELKRPYFPEKFTRGMAALRGVEVGLELAEAFVVQRMVFKWD